MKLYVQVQSLATLRLDALDDHIKYRGMYFTAAMYDIIYLYRDIVIFGTSLFDRVVTGSTYLILYHRINHKGSHKLFIRR